LESEQLRRELLAAAVEPAGPKHYGGERHETGVQKAERIMREDLLKDKPEEPAAQEVRPLCRWRHWPAQGFSGDTGCPGTRSGHGCLTGRLLGR
jgi:hypothetical protein